MFFRSRRQGEPRWLLVFLGNPGAKYGATRHNAGFFAADWLSEACEIKINKVKFNALTALCTIAGEKVFVMKPQTYMNLSGEAVKPAADFYKIPAERIIVICDDVALPCGKIRVRRSGSAGGHNGLKSIISRLGTENFPRVKIGVGSPDNPEQDMISWVIGEVSKEELGIIKESAKKALAAAEEIISSGIDSAMNKYN